MEPSFMRTVLSHKWAMNRSIHFEPFHTNRDVVENTCVSESQIFMTFRLLLKLSQIRRLNTIKFCEWSNFEIRQDRLGQCTPILILIFWSHFNWFRSCLALSYQAGVRNLLSQFWCTSTLNKKDCAILLLCYTVTPAAIATETLFSFAISPSRGQHLLLCLFCLDVFAYSLELGKMDLTEISAFCHLHGDQSGTFGSLTQGDLRC